MKKGMEIGEKKRTTPVVYDCDVCVVGGSCTGVFAAVRAARLGARVALVEKQNSFGGVATQGLVNIWHSFKDTEFRLEIIAGLSLEVVERLKKRDAVVVSDANEHACFYLNTEELKIELDELVVENGIRPFLHTFFVAPHIGDDGALDAVIVENKSGRSAIRAKYFIDATGDGDVAARLGLPFRGGRGVQPPTTCARIHGTGGLNIGQLIERHGAEFGLPDDWGWNCDCVGLPGMKMHADTHVFNVNCSDAEELTHAEIEGRRTVRAYMDIIRRHTKQKVALSDLASYIGIRETRRFDCRSRILEKELLDGREFEDAIGYGSYRVDVHHDDRPGITFRYLDGRELSFEKGRGWIEGRWREKTPANPTFYQIPLGAMIPGKIPNLILCGRSIDCDGGAYGAVRVMVNLNQTGEAAGVAAATALDRGETLNSVSACEVRRRLKKGGSIIFEKKQFEA